MEKFIQRDRQRKRKNLTQRNKANNFDRPGLLNCSRISKNNNYIRLVI